jgi:hypothetical protein
MTLTVKTLSLGMLALALGAVVACVPDKPATPTYAKDVGPIFAAHCNRCHSAKGPGGSLQGDPMTATTPAKMPAACKFDFYDSSDTATCTAAAGGAAPPISCWGAHYCVTGSPYAAVVSHYIRGDVDPMPPPPASLMNDWEVDVMTAWLKNPLP